MDIPAAALHIVVLPAQTAASPPVIVQGGNGLTVTSTVKGIPAHPLAVGVIVYLTMPAVVPVLVSVCAIIVPHAEEQLLKPVIVPPVGEVRINAVHVKVVPMISLDNAIVGAVLEQIDCDDGIAVVTGKGLITKSTHTGALVQPTAEFAVTQM